MGFGITSVMNNIGTDDIVILDLTDLKIALGSLLASRYNVRLLIRENLKKATAFKNVIY